MLITIVSIFSSVENCQTLLICSSLLPFLQIYLFFHLQNNGNEIQDILYFILYNILPELGINHEFSLQFFSRGSVKDN